MDIPLLLENKINDKKDVLVFVQSKKLDIEKKLKKRIGFNKKIINSFRKIQLPLDYKKKNLTLLLRIILQKNLLGKRLSIY